MIKVRKNLKSKFFLLNVVLSYFKIEKLFLNEYVIYPNLCANCEFEINRAIGAVVNCFICFHRFIDKIGSVRFIYKYILQLNIPKL